jgi:GntR family transcriptional regulator
MTEPVLRRSSGAALHHQLSTILRSAIVSGRYLPGDYLPGENTLVSTYGVSRATVRRALLTLESECLIERRAGKGTRIRAMTVSQVPTSMDMHKRQLEQGAKRTTIRVLGIEEIAAPADLAVPLRISEGNPVLVVTRVRYTRRMPLRYMTTYLELGLGRSLDMRALRTTTIVEMLGRVGRPVYRSEDEIGATLADPILAEALDRRVGDALLDMKRIMYDRLGEPLAFQRTIASPEVFRLRVLIAGEEVMPSLADITALQPMTNR